MASSFTRFMIVTLLIMAAILSYVDRGNLSVAEGVIAKDFKLDPLQMGWLMSAFFWSYSTIQIASGWLTDRYEVKWVFAWGYLVWTIATLATGFVGGFVSLFIMRLLLGAGESVVYPAISRILLEHFPEDRRGLPNALIAAGTKIGPAISMFLGGLILVHYGWRQLFIFTGLVSLAWLVPWAIFVPKSNTVPVSQTVKKKSVSFGELLSRPEFWGTTIGFFSLGYAIYLLINWLPSYLEKGRGFSTEQMATAGSIPFWIMGGATVLGGIAGDWWIRRGASPTLSRLGILIGGFALCAVFILIAPYVSNDNICLLCLAVACAGLGLFSSNAWAVTQTLSGEYAAAKWSGTQNALGNFGGVASSVFTGWLLKRTGSFDLAFVSASVMVVIGILAYVFLVGRVVPVDWDSETIGIELQSEPVVS